MKPLTLFLLNLLLFSWPALSQPRLIYELSDVRALYEIDSLYRNGETYEAANQAVKQLLASNSILKEDRSLYYRLSRAYKISGQLDSAKKYLLTALNMGLYCLENCGDYSDRAIFDSATNVVVVSLFKVNQQQRSVDSGLIKKIAEMKERDQAMRREYKKANYDTANKAVYALVQRVDSMNTREVKQIIHRYGWPGYKILGRKGDKDFWLMVQHADKDVVFQQYALQLMGAAVLANNTDKHYYAYLFDRVCINMGVPQVFGTQFYFKDIDGQRTLIPHPLRDTLNLDYYRVAFGMAKFDEHLRSVDAEYNTRKD